MVSGNYQVFSDSALLRAPVKRAAYSNRMALLMAEMSKLAYERFEDGRDLDSSEIGSLDRLIQSIKTGPNQDDARNALLKFLRNPPEDYQRDNRNALISVLEKPLFKLVNTYNAGGTQAFLAKKEPQSGPSGTEEGMAILSFRGTEKDIKDVKTDLRANVVLVGGMRVHSGFWEALKCQARQFFRDIGYYPGNVGCTGAHLRP